MPMVAVGAWGDFFVVVYFLCESQAVQKRMLIWSTDRWKADVVGAIYS